MTIGNKGLFSRLTCDDGLSLYGLLFCVLFNSIFLTGSILLFLDIEDGVVISGGLFWFGEGVVGLSLEGVVVVTLDGVVVVTLDGVVVVTLDGVVVVTLEGVVDDDGDGDNKPELGDGEKEGLGAYKVDKGEGVVSFFIMFRLYFLNLLYFQSLDLMNWREFYQ